jgi:transcriptional regulator with XRE-family HTH domain
MAEATDRIGKWGKPMPDLDRSLGANLRNWRKTRGLSQEALAELAEVHRTEIGLLERGKRDPGFGIITRLAGALEIPPGELFAGLAFDPARGFGRGRFVYEEGRGGD